VAYLLSTCVAFACDVLWINVLSTDRNTNHQTRQMKQHVCTLHGSVSREMWGSGDHACTMCLWGRRLVGYPKFRKVNQQDFCTSFHGANQQLHSFFKPFPAGQMGSYVPNSRHDLNWTSRCAHSDRHEHQVRLLWRGSSMVTVEWECARFSMGVPTVALQSVRKFLVADCRVKRRPTRGQRKRDGGLRSLPDKLKVELTWTSFRLDVLIMERLVPPACITGGQLHGKLI